MKRDRKRAIRDYSKFDPYSKEYNGLLVKKGRLSIDVKRLRKADPWIISEGVIDSICDIPRSTPYFHPKKKKRYDYYCNIFSDGISSIFYEWHNGLKSVVYMIKTPSERSHAYHVDSMQDGVMNHEECSTVTNMKAIEYSRSYDWTLKMIYAQYIHYVGSRSEQLITSVIVKDNTNLKYFSKKILINILQKKYNVILEDIPNYQEYVRLHAMYNFLKHSNLSAYKQAKKYGDVIESVPYKNGAYSLKYIMLDEEKMISLIKGLGRFFDSFCEKVFKENVENAKWNYDDYFLEKYKEYINFIDNPLCIKV